MAPGAFFAIWVNESPFWVQAGVLVLTNVAMWAFFLYGAIFIALWLRRTLKGA